MCVSGKPVRRVGSRRKRAAAQIYVGLRIIRCPIPKTTARKTPLASFYRRRRVQGWAGETCCHRNVVGLTVERLTRAARAHVPKPQRHAACPHLKRATQAA